MQVKTTMSNNDCSVTFDNRKKYILILCKGLIDDNTITGKAKYYINFSEKWIAFSWFCIAIEVTVWLHVTGIKIYKFKEKDSEIKVYPLFLGNISIYFSVDNMRKLDFMDRFAIFDLIMIRWMLMIV